MPVPAWPQPFPQAFGARAQSGGAASISPAKPSVLGVAGILIAVVTSKNNAPHSTGTSGWALIGQVNSGADFTASLWIAAETASAPTFSWSGSVACSARIGYYASIDGPTATTLGATTSNSGSGNPHSTGAINTTRDDSVVLYVDVAAANTALAEPSGWTEDQDSGSVTDGGRTVFGRRSMAASGSSTGAISVTGANTAWVQWQIELQAATATGLTVTKAEALAVITPPDGLLVTKAEILAVLRPTVQPGAMRRRRMAVVN